MKRVISFSLWGDNPKYTVGAVKNGRLCGEIYPGWIARFYAGASVPVEILRQLQLLGAEVVEKGEPGDWRAMFWRFEAASDPEVEAMLSRDCDSRLNAREAAAVSQWMESGAPFHIMRDHPAHCARILGGMWGVKAPLLREMNDLIAGYEKGDFWQVDQRFLAEVIYPRVRKRAMVHDEFFRGIAFPTPRRGLEFVGQVFDENDETPVEDQRLLAQALEAGLIRSTLRRLRVR